jgi:hypothetical protein
VRRLFATTHQPTGDAMTRMLLLVRLFVRQFFDDYRPERHYMRGGRPH